MANIIEISLVIIGTIIGAGFASGKEITIFFAQYGIQGIIGIAITIIIMSFFIYRILNTSVKNKKTSYLELLKLKKIKHIDIINNAVNIFLLISFIIMVAGFRSYIRESTGSNALIITILFTFICYLIFNKKADGIIKSNKYLVPMLVMLIFVISIKYNVNCNAKAYETRTSIGNPIISAIMYAGYNSIVIVPVIVSLSKKIKKSSECRRIALLSMILMIMLFGSIFITLIHGGEDCQSTEFPILYISKQMGKMYNKIYSVIIVLSIFTSAISSGYAYLNDRVRNKRSYKILSAVICILAVLCSEIGFGNLVQKIYPMFGVIGMGLTLICL